MFSGIVAGLEPAINIKKTSNSMEVSLKIPNGWQVGMGDSINIDGVCSTVKQKSADSFSVFYMAETLRKTNLSETGLDHQFNLETSLNLNSLIGGHLVSGHIDTTAEVISIKNEGESRLITFKIDKQFTNYIIYKGSIAVNGVSLTIVEVGDDSFSISLIPYTLEHTNLGKLEIKTKVNIEVDLMAKYMEKMLKPYIAKIKNG